MRLAETKVHREDMGDEFNPANHNRREQESSDRKCADTDEENVDGAGDPLAATAMAALGEMLVVVRAHGWREARYVVTPS